MNMKKFLSVLVVLLALCGVQARAQEESDKVVIQSATIAAGEEFLLPVELVNEISYRAFQMDIVLPEGITPVLTKNKKGENHVVPVKDPVRFEETNHSFSDNYMVEERTIKLVCTSMTDGDEFWEKVEPYFL